MKVISNAELTQTLRLLRALSEGRVGDEAKRQARNLERKLTKRL